MKRGSQLGQQDENIKTGLASLSVPLLIFASGTRDWTGLSLGTAHPLGDIYLVMQEVKPALPFLKEPLGYCLWPKEGSNFPFLLGSSFFRGCYTVTSLILLVAFG